MSPKFIRYITSTIEEGILSSFRDVTLVKDTLWEKSLLSRMIILWRRGIKRCIDFLLSMILLIISMPVFIAVAVAIKITDRGPIFFKQQRIGMNGEKFLIWKFCTMKEEDQESEHKEYIQYLLNEENENGERTDILHKYVLFLDGRITRVGRFLRLTSLDELPQLINIFAGNMSFVGPRPHPIYEVEEYKEWYHRRLDVKPGLTGWSKLNLRCTPKNYEESILYDLWYVDNQSLLLDLRIMIKTIPFVLSMKDAQ